MIRWSTAATAAVSALRIAHRENHQQRTVGEGEGWLDSLAGVRGELLVGDVRALYVGSLLGRDELLLQVAMGEQGRAPAGFLRRSRVETRGPTHETARPRFTAEALLARAAKLREAEEREWAQKAEGERLELGPRISTM